MNRKVDFLGLLLAIAFLAAIGAAIYYTNVMYFKFMLRLVK